jgi:hypothetical protein
MFTPAPLFPGARVALLCTSSAVPDGRLAPAVAAVRSLDLEPVTYPSCTELHGYFSGDDARRAADLNAAFADESIDGILCARGGYGAHRLLPLLDFDVIAAHPKFFSGYSDVTALHTAFQQECGFVTYHTIMPTTEYYQPVDCYSMDYLRRALFGCLTGPLCNPPDQPPVTLAGGRSPRPLCGGNLSLLAPPWAPPGRSTPGANSSSWRTSGKRPTASTGCSPNSATPENWTTALGCCWAPGPTAAGRPRPDPAAAGSLPGAHSPGGQAHSGGLAAAMYCPPWPCPWERRSHWMPTPAHWR